MALAYMTADGEVVPERRAERRVLAERAALGAGRHHEVGRETLAEAELTCKRGRVLPAAAWQVADVAGHREAVLKRRRHRRLPEGELARFYSKVQYERTMFFK